MSKLHAIAALTVLLLLTPILYSIAIAAGASAPVADLSSSITTLGVLAGIFRHNYLRSQ